MNRRDFFRTAAPIALAGGLVPLAAAVVAADTEPMPEHTGFLKVHARPGERFYIATYALPDGPDRIEVKRP